VKGPKPRIILDCDPGHDDALAMLLAGRQCEVVGITTVSGNAPLELTTRNALIISQILDLDIPVHAGVARPLVAEPRHAAYIHGESGLEGPELPELARAATSHDAVRFIVHTVRTQDDLWLVATGPLTNVALALREEPDLAGKLAGISIMGGSSSFGNVTPTAEFNIWADPEAAAIVFASGAKLFMCGLNVTHQFTVDEAFIAQAWVAGNRVGTFVAELLTYYTASYAKTSGKYKGPLHDPCAVLAITHPELFTFKPRPVSVELTGQFTRGMTVTDEREHMGPAVANVQVAYRIDRERGLELLLEAIRRYP
jgi:inosine-uridine nucleoside N-ribohydrolase